MRSWSVPVTALCRQHLLGEHVEVHTMWSALLRGDGGYWKHPETQRWVGHLAALHARHEAHALEIGARGWNHRSPLVTEGIEDWGSTSTPPRIAGDVPVCDRCDVAGIERRVN